jgi:hypothetical protein
MIRVWSQVTTTTDKKWPSRSARWLRPVVRCRPSDDRRGPGPAAEPRNVFPNPAQQRSFHELLRRLRVRMPNVDRAHRNQRSRPLGDPRAVTGLAEAAAALQQAACHRPEIGDKPWD